MSETAMTRSKTKSTRVGITLVAKLRNTVLHELAKKVGGQSALAKLLGVTPQMMGSWCNLTRCPPKHPTPQWSAARLRKLDKQLLELTGKLTDEIFPDMLRDNLAFRTAPKTREKAVEVESAGLTALAENFANRTRQLHLQVDDLDADAHRAHMVAKYLGHVENPLDKEVVIKHLGLDGQPPMTLDELCVEHNVTRERIRQRYARGLGQMQDAAYASKMTEAVAELLGQPVPKLSPLSDKKVVVIDVKTYQHKQFEEAIT